MSVTELKLAFCPLCGQESLSKSVSPSIRYQCDKCDFVMFQNVAAAVMVAVCYGDEILVATRGREPGKGLWDLPGGFVDPDETLEQAVVRELHEELGLELKIDQAEYLASNPNTYPYKGIVYKTNDTFFRIVLDAKPELVAQDDVESIEWVKLADLDIERFAFTSAKSAIQTLQSLR
ncbi:NUDIX domain-containing protein [Vibrio sp. SCSIO 43137]|uniref:NUDIX domain-containing protein n=1 Tax=Vibrio sp. SCSIO 43137 TaxID=3021011 RepID=UPI002307C96F|nr:NUDIX domain-containing protein [Vibrio sp. SCSIO 43137]WCE32144.1 NUDIX domain-containing protein [Vibrio sp. SCSIO 43137]